MAKQLSAAAIMALKEALSCVYWYKSELEGFLRVCLSNPTLISQFNWNNYKRQIASDVVDYLVAKPETHLGDLTKLCYELCHFTDFSHLTALDEGTQKAERAKAAVVRLKQLVEPHQDHKKEQDEIRRRQVAAAEKLSRNAAVRKKLEDIKSVYMSLISTVDPQQRGFELEKIMYDLFELFDLDPKASFRNLGEQIDGAFTLESTDYLFEAKWHKELVNKAHLAAFSEKVETKLENTLGVFLSINGFSQDGVTAHQAGGSSIILMDGSDLMAVLEERVDFITLLLRKKQHASRTGEIYLPFYKMIASGS